MAFDVLGYLCVHYRSNVWEVISVKIIIIMTHTVNVIVNGELYYDSHY